MKIWVDDLRPAPDGFIWCKSVNETKEIIKFLEDLASYGMFYNPTTLEERRVTIDLIDLDHDAGDYAKDGGDYIKILDWMEATGRSYPIHIHTANPVGRWNMLLIAEKNNWEIEKWPCY